MIVRFCHLYSALNLRSHTDAHYTTLDRAEAHLQPILGQENEKWERRVVSQYFKTSKDTNTCVLTFLKTESYIAI